MLILFLFQQATIAFLKDEIQQLESDLTRSQEYLTTTKTEHQAFLNAVAAVEDQRYLASNLTKFTAESQSAERRFVTLEGATKWKLSKANEAELTINYLGPCSSVCMSLTSTPSTQECTLTKCPALYQKVSLQRAKQLASMTPFLQKCVTTICENVSQVRYAPQQLVQLFNRLDLQMTRVENTATELAMLKRRYNAKISPCKASRSNTFAIEIIFVNKSNVAILRATFEISQQYPFSPLDVCLDTFDDLIDVGLMRKLLIKNAKPGFGYLSRTCDIIATRIKHL